MMEDAIATELTKRLTEKLVKHAVIGRHIETVEEFQELISMQASVFNEIFDKNPQEMHKYFYDLAAEVKNKYNIPFEDVIYIVEALEHELFNLIEHKIISIDIKFITKRFEIIKLGVAKSYFYLIVEDMIVFLNSSTSDVKYVSSLAIHREWVEHFALFIKNSDHSVEFSFDHLTCNLSKWLNGMEFDMYVYSMQEDQTDIYAKIFLTHRELHDEAFHIISMVSNSDYELGVHHLNRMSKLSLHLEEYLRTIQINYIRYKNINFFNYVQYKSKYEDGLYYFSSIIFDAATPDKIKEFLYKNSYQIESVFKELMIKNSFDGVVYVNEHSVNLLFKEQKNSNGLKALELIKKHIYKEIVSMTSKEKMKVNMVGVKIDDIYQISRDVVPILHLIKKHKPKKEVSLLAVSDIKIIYGKVVERDKIKAEIDKAFSENLFELFFQPIVKGAAQSKELLVEALIRLPYKGSYLNGENFIELIEEQNGMAKLDIYVLKHIYEYIQKLSEAAAKVSVNIYPSSFEDKEVLHEIVLLSKALAKAGVELIIEITEQILLFSKENILKLSKEHGISFAIDDFGSGYSSFVQLVELVEMGMIKIVKIDGSIVRGSEDNLTKYNILKALSKMIAGLNNQIVFEYVENEKLYNKLKDMQGDILYQGYYFDKALSIDQLVAKYKK